MDSQTFEKEELTAAILALMFTELVGRFYRRFGVCRVKGGGGGGRRVSGRADGRLVSDRGRVRRCFGIRGIKMHLHVGFKGQVQEERSVANTTDVFALLVLVAVSGIYG